ncbi:MAG: hypothetical protein JO293_04465 [Candidatus Eremiobacteraeota bacterium]|nr:hypothetical protein [Candidatus Eremiobacteraeota bacterium]
MSGVAVVLSILKAPWFPINDPALFEYFGRAMVRGQRLYVDILDTKLPGIYLVNALWQRLFGEHYFVHVLAEAAVGVATVVLFALLLRRAGVGAWAFGTCLFAWFYLVPFPQFDFSQHYAAFLLVLGLYLTFSRQNGIGGAMVALGSSFWFPGGLTCIPVLLRPVKREERVTFLAGFLWGVAFYAALMTVFWGRDIFHERAMLWQQYVQHRKIDLGQLNVTVSYSTLGPAIAAMLAWLGLVIRRPQTPAQRFALIWSGCALIGFLIPPTFSEHYLLPSTAALAMAIASYPFEWRLVLERQIAVLVVVVCAWFSAQRSLVTARTYHSYAAMVQNVGTWIRGDAGSGLILYSREYIPEIQLAADARLVSPTGFLDYDEKMNALERLPQIIVWGTHSWPGEVVRHETIFARTAAGSLMYYPVCVGRTGSLALYAPASIKFKDCPLSNQ